MDIIEFILNLIKLLWHMFEVATDIAASHRKKLTAISGVMFGACTIYLWNIHSLDQASAFPLALFLVSGIYLSYALTKWIITSFRA